MTSTTLSSTANQTAVTSTSHSEIHQTHPEKNPSLPHLPPAKHPTALDSATAAANLDALTKQVQQDLALFAPKHDWVPRTAADVYEVIIIGGGQAGLGTAFALQRQRIPGVKVLDANSPDHVGCWTTYARMHTLRSPKHMRCIELDIPNLHPQRWFSAKYGAAAWDAISVIPRQDWNEYLMWYRDTTGIDVTSNTLVTEVSAPDADGYFHVTTRPATHEFSNSTTAQEVTTDATDAGVETYKAKRVVYAIGLDGGGGPFIPEMLKALPDELYAHTEDPIDFTALAGKRVAVLGAGASGFDNASTALEHGAASVAVHMRRSEVPRENSLRWMEFPGMQEHFYDLSDAQKWEFSVFNGGLPQPPTQATIWRAFGYDNFSLIPNSQWTNISLHDDDGGQYMTITNAAGESFDADFIIAATGYTIDLYNRPELANFADDITLWSDVYAPAADHPMGAYPYLGDGFQFIARGNAPRSTASTDEASSTVENPDTTNSDATAYMGRLYHLSTGARVSHGIAGNQLSGIFAGITRVAQRITTDITKEHWPEYMEQFRNFHNIEVTSVAPHQAGDPWFPQTPRY
ncbi:MAG: NAD(P)/FAD-dependent oxidoreductase [Corynebacterium sp.]|nr:NAD(P)/FAD-dependent oxidoreductase [Corynebacterium sp.]